MKECEFKKECTMAAQGRPCPFSDSEAKTRRCDDRKFAILVRNKGLWIAQKELQLADSKADAIGRVEALKMKESP